MHQMIKTRLVHKMKIWGHIVLCGCILLLQSCVSEDEIDFPDDESPISYSESVALISVMRAIESNKLMRDGCFEFSFPLQIRFNNNISVTVSDFNGLSEIASNSTASQHPNALDFPFDIIKNGSTVSISNEAEFISLLDDCQILTLRDEFDPFFTQCFDLVYPLTMLDVNGNEVVISSQSAYFDFELQQGFDKQPKFVFPIQLFDYATESNLSVGNPFELFEIFDSCSRCPELFFRIDTVRVNRFAFIAGFDRIESLSYGWYIDNEKVEEDGGAVQGDNMLTETFPSGEYEICIRTSLPADDCFSGTQYCERITVDACPFVSFVSEQVNANTYEFIANFASKDLVDFTWIILQNEDIIFEELENAQGDNKLFYQFNPGVYQVCLEAEVDQCPEILKTCIELSID